MLARGGRWAAVSARLSRRLCSFRGAVNGVGGGSCECRIAAVGSSDGWRGVGARTPQPSTDEGGRLGHRTHSSAP